MPAMSAENNHVREPGPNGGVVAAMIRDMAHGVCVYDDAVLPAAAAEWIAMAIEKAVAARGRCTLALAGGSTPRRTYEILASSPLAERIPWDRVEIYFSDERAVPPIDDASNYRMAAESLLRRVALRPEQIHRMKGEGADLDAAAREYDRQLPERLDLLLLGMGTDGHIASLYPDSDALYRFDTRVVMVPGPAPTRPRLTFTPAAIAAAHQVGVLVAGAAKAGMVARVLHGTDTVSSVPARLVRAATWLVDRSAASRLDPRWCGGDVVLAGDVGGTGLRLALVDGTAGRLQVLAQRRYPTRQFAALHEAVALFAEEVGTLPARACFAVACPRPEEDCRMPNLPWVIRPAVLAHAIGIPASSLLNDVAAVGHAIPHLSPADLIPLQEGVRDPGGTIAFLGAGTGLGAGFAFGAGDTYTVRESEAGHADFAPTTRRQEQLANYLEAAYGHVSCERVLSGAGLADMYRFLSSLTPGRARRSTAAAMERTDPASVVMRRALDHSDTLCEEAVELFIEVLGAVAGNLALNVLATGGVYLAGGMAPRLAAHLASEPFLSAFRQKGRMSGVLERIPVHVIAQPDAGVIGAAAAAFRSRVRSPARP